MQQVVETFIIEDNPKMLKYLQELVIRNPDLVLNGSASGREEAIQKLRKNRPELLLMDIELGDGTAFEILDEFRGREFQVIFVTGFEEYIQKAFEYYAFYFLMKPFDEGKFNQIVSAYRQRKNWLFDYRKFDFLQNHLVRGDSSFLLHAGNEYVAIDLDKLTFCKSEGNYTEFNFLDRKKILASRPLKFYEKLFINRGFFRASRFYLVNGKNIKSIYKKESVILKDKKKITISTRNRDSLSDLIARINR